MTTKNLLACSLLCLTACSTHPPAPPPVTEAGSQAPIERSSPIEQDVEARPAPTTKAATATLLARAKRAVDDQQAATAITYLERAIRLEPRNPELWTALAQAHLANGSLVSANQYARKAIALSASDPSQHRLAWLQLADIKDAEGQDAEARSIRRRYSSARG
ncbi:MAG: Flp pilus assembly protein TadD [Limisphaerales bacterium]|jgi:Flp pilus assembly protein TadD